jgi:MFS family permease
MAMLGTASISPAFPEIQEVFGVSRGQVAMLISVFTLPGVLLTPVVGALSDRFGRRKILVPSLLLFGLAGGACALARNFELLLVLRALQGTGAASLRDQPDARWRPLRGPDAHGGDGLQLERA